ncbi:hypothetical protein E2C01_047632 [Portunus trituberculatus]|uniref:Uncharacterized protein n=1 Tax=Portunus trituberculatus TaxID=210409 RepID=A0A5B7G451_PORTR|nr:hypothetical protein [Portunus trituberculatus]
MRGTFRESRCLSYPMAPLKIFNHFSLITISLKKTPQPLPELEVEVGVKALGAGEPPAMIPIRFCLGSNHANPLGANAPQGPAYQYDGCRGKLTRSLCRERDGRIPLPYF